MGGLADRDQKSAQRRVRAAAVPSGGPQATSRALERVADARAIVLVEGISDQIALAPLAARRGRNLDGAGIAGLARPTNRRTAAALHGQRRPPQAPLRTSARRGARSWAGTSAAGRRACSRA